jgi:hypothetical protein
MKSTSSALPQNRNSALYAKDVVKHCLPLGGDKFLSSVEPEEQG